MKNSNTIIARNKRNCCLKQSSFEHSGAVDVISHWCSIGLMAPTILYLVESFDDCAYNKRKVAPTNVSLCVSANESAYLHTWTLLHLNEALSQEDDNQRQRRL